MGRYNQRSNYFGANPLDQIAWKMGVPSSYMKLVRFLQNPYSMFSGGMDVEDPLGSLIEQFTPPRGRKRKAGGPPVYKTPTPVKNPLYPNLSNKLKFKGGQQLIEEKKKRKYKPGRRSRQGTWWVAGRRRGFYDPEKKRLRRGYKGIKRY